MRHRVGSAKRDNPERSVLSSQALKHIVNSSITPAGNDGVESVANSHAHLRSRVGRGASRRDIDLNPCRSQDSSSGFNVGDAMLTPAA